MKGQVVVIILMVSFDKLRAGSKPRLTVEGSPGVVTLSLPKGRSVGLRHTGFDNVMVSLSNHSLTA